MEINIRKQFSKNYQVFEIALENVPNEKLDSANEWLNEIGTKEINQMANLMSEEVVDKPTYSKPTYNKPAYTPRQNTSGKPASVKQIEWLNKYNIDFDPATITSAEASKLLDGAFNHKKEETAPKKTGFRSDETSTNDPYEQMGQRVANDEIELPF